MTAADLAAEGRRTIRESRRPPPSQTTAAPPPVVSYSAKVAIAGIVLGAIERYAFGFPEYAAGLWLVALVLAGAPVVWRTINAARVGNYATDVVASLSIITAAVIGQPFPGLVIVLMQTGGESLERFAERRASRAVSELEKAAPRIAHRISSDRGLIDVPVGELEIGDVFLVRPGEMIPCDGVVLSGISEIDASPLTGEAMPVAANEGTRVMSGSFNAHGVLSIRATALAAESQYSKIVELVRAAQATKAPLQRLADRYALWFTPVTLFVCVLTYAVTRNWNGVLAVLVVATPCPLILATPVAIIGGVNRAARRRVIVRHGAALEMLSRVTLAVFDKTGTLTIGKPSVKEVIPFSGHTERSLLQQAAAVEEGSSHLLAQVIVDEAKRRYGKLQPAKHHRENPGEGLAGVVGGHEVVVGSRAFVERHSTELLSAFDTLDETQPALRAYVLIGGKAAGVIEYADAIRPELPSFLESLKALGVRRTVLLSGDRTANARAVGNDVGITEVYGELMPGDKATLVSRFRARGDVVMMVGDGTHDAPALAAADVGVALAGHGGGISSEAADVVVLIDDLSRAADAVAIGQRTMRLARQSIIAGLTLSGVAMVFAAFGYIQPTEGALLQEAIDVAVILNALRASGQ